MLKVYDLRTEYRENPLGISSRTPRLGWKLSGDGENLRQEAYRVQAFSNGETVWDSGLISSGESQRIRYAGTPLGSGQRVTWRVTLRAGGEVAESEEASFETALDPSDWEARWIQPEREIDYDAYKPSPRLRRSFAVKPGLVRARIYQTAHGLYEFWINGKAGTDEKFKPGITSYYYRAAYQSYDVLPLLREGENVWAVQLGDGWWRGNTGGGNRNNFGFYLSFIGQLVLEYADGSREVIATDERFHTAPSERLRCDMKVGEIYDARLASDDWKLPGYVESGWDSVVPAAEYPSLDVLVPSDSVPVKEHEVLEGKPFRDAAGNLVLDFGQNHTGYVRMVLRNTKPGQVVTLTHGEGLKDGVFSIANLEETSKDPFQQVVYLCRGGEEETYVPLFAVFGFRYVLLEGYDSEIQPGDFRSPAVYSAMEETGNFSCSNPLVNQLVSNSRWSMKSNFLDAPTDCPTRERSTWSGDAEVFCKTAADFMNVYPFFEKWLKDLSAEQFEDGCVGNTIPSTNALHNPVERQRMLEQGRFVFAPPTLAGPKGNGEMMDGSVGWGNVAIVVPYTMYLCYGDKQILENQYESAKRWVDFERNNAKKHNPLYEAQSEYHTFCDGVADADYIYDTHFQWGEWLEPDAVENGGSASFDPMVMHRNGNPLVATAYLYYDCSLLAKLAGILGKTEDEAFYSAYTANVKRVYNKYFIKPDGTILEGRQAPYARTLALGLADEEHEPLVAKKLAEAVEQAGYTVNTGFLSTPFLLPQLCDYGYVSHAFRLLEQTAFPSWLHPITLGATTILENWGGLDDYRASFNHYSYGAVCDFLVSRVGGIRPLESAPGYQEFVVEPITGGTLTWAEASYESLYGTIRSKWSLEDGKARYTVTIPANTTAEVILPRDAVSEEICAALGGLTEGAKVRFRLGSGTYAF